MRRKDGRPDRRFKANKGSSGCVVMIAALGVAALMLLAAASAASRLLSWRCGGERVLASPDGLDGRARDPVIELLQRYRISAAGSKRD